MFNIADEFYFAYIRCDNCMHILREPYIRFEKEIRRYVSGDFEENYTEKCNNCSGINEICIIYNNEDGFFASVNCVSVSAEKCHRHKFKLIKNSIIDNSYMCCKCGYSMFIKELRRFENE